MFNKQILSKIFKTNEIYYVKYENNIAYIEIKNNNCVIIILDNFNYEDQLENLNMYLLQRKNCWIMKDSKLTKTHLYFHEDFIKSIIRQKIINTIVND